MALDEKVIFEGNELIAKFIGWRWEWKGEGNYRAFQFYYKDDLRFQDDEKYLQEFLPALKYHSDWNRLIQVIEVIDSLGYPDREDERACHTIHYSHIFYIHYNYTLGSSHYSWWPSYKEGRHRCENEERIENVYLAIVDFIKWYNEKVKSKA